MIRDPKTASPPPVFEQLSLLQVRLSKLALLLGDLLALLLAFVLATTLAIGLASSTPGVWFAGQDQPRFVSWVGVGLLGIVLLLTRYQHYSDRRTFLGRTGRLHSTRVLVGIA